MFNVDEGALGDAGLAADLAERVRPAPAVVLCAQIEAEVAGLDPADAKELLRSYGQEESGLEQLVHVGFATLGLQTFLTAGPKEARAWTIHVGDTAPKAAGVIHTDFERGFIKAEVISFDDLMAGGLGRRGAQRRQGTHGGQGLRHARRRRRGVPLQHLRTAGLNGPRSGPPQADRAGRVPRMLPGRRRRLGAAQRGSRAGRGDVRAEEPADRCQRVGRRPGGSLRVLEVAHAAVVEEGPQLRVEPSFQVRRRGVDEAFAAVGVDEDVAVGVGDVVGERRCR